ncbi:hypothetical protein ACRPOS_004535 [Bartonella heixiaziensis]|uniref:hypothetical protein n=1 Tax=Bartonella heixiaziensis TaxID=1461000 RepID=UPI0039088D10
MKKLALVCQRNAKLPFIFEAAKAANIELVMIYDIAESAPIQLPAAVTSTWQLPVFDNPELALDAFAAGVKERNIGGGYDPLRKSHHMDSFSCKKNQYSQY